MRADTLLNLDRWWRAELLVDDELWTASTVRRRTRPSGDERADRSWVVVRRGAVVHVVAPAWAEAVPAPSVELVQPASWAAYAEQRGAAVLGPTIHHYLDRDPGVAAGVRRVDPADLRPLVESVAPGDLWSSGFDVHLDAPGVVAFATEGGGAVLTELDGAPRNVALLVATDARGRGVGVAVGQAAASFAVRHHGWCRWRSDPANVASTRAAERLGFEAYCTQLTIREQATRLR